MVKEKKLYSTVLLLFGILAPMPLISFFSITMYVWGIMILGMIALMEWVNQGRMKLDRQSDRAFGQTVSEKDLCKRVFLLLYVSFSHNEKKYNTLRIT